jgi:hypothetical protein
MTARSIALGCLMAASAPAFGQAPSPLWGTTFGTVPSTQAKAAAADSTGGVYTTGYVFSYGPWYGPALGSGDAFLLRFSPSGSLVWGRRFGSADYEYGAGVCGDGAGGAYVTGPLGGGSVFLARFNSEGEQLWYRSFTSGSTDYVQAIAPDGAGGCFLSGTTRGSLAGPNAGQEDAFVVRYDEDGNQLWARQFGSEQADLCEAACADSAGGVILSGRTSGVLGVASFGFGDAWIARYDADGNRLWIVQVGTPAPEALMALCADGVGGFYAGGSTSGSWGGPSAGGSDAVLLHLTGSGQVLWVRQLGTNEPEYARSLATDAAGGVYVFGDTFGSLGGPHNLGRETYLAHYAPSGAPLWVTQMGTPDDDMPGGAAPDASGGVYIAGYRTNMNTLVSTGTLARYPGLCYPNCDHSTSLPLLNVLDFNCFLNRFVTSDAYANCDGSTAPPTLNVLDFNCFLNAFTAGCP